MMLVGRSSTKRLKTNDRNSPPKFGDGAAHTELTGAAGRVNNEMHSPAKLPKIVKNLEKPLFAGTW